MLVKDFLKNFADEFEIKIYQIPIKEIDSCPNLVNRFQGSVSTALSSNQNYLNFKLKKHYCENNILVLVCEANKEQEEKTINAYKCKKF